MYNFDALGLEEEDTPQEDISQSLADIAQPIKLEKPSFHSVDKKTPNPVTLTENWTSNDPSILCRYNGHVRPVHPAACEYHRFSGDQECTLRRCPRVRLGININPLMQTTEGIA